MKTVVLLSGIILLVTNNCTNKSPIPCPLCIDPAFEIAIVDSMGATIHGFTIRAISAENETTFVSDTSNRYGYIGPGGIHEIIAKKGTYQLEIENPKYKAIHLNNIAVTEGACGVNPRLLKIEPEAATLSKADLPMDTLPYRLLIDSVGKGCGN